MSDVRDSPFAAGTPAGMQCVGPTFSCPPMSPSVRCPFCRGPGLEVEVPLRLHTAVTREVLHR